MTTPSHSYPTLPARLMHHATMLALVAIVLLAVYAWANVFRAVATPALAVANAGSPGPANVLAQFTRAWRDDPTWHDGQAEIALYDATRTIYGQPRHYVARVMTNKEHADPETKTKSDAGIGRAVFKHHVREDIPTEHYTYHYSTMAYVGTDDLKSLKLDMGSQEDCGASFKQYVNHAGALTWRQFTYFPHEGARSGAYAPSDHFAFQDALSLILRGYPFDDPPRILRLAVLDDQTTNHLSRAEPSKAAVFYVGRETLALPIGPTDAHHLRVRHHRPTDGQNAPVQDQVHDYYFAADGSPPLLHVLVRYDGPNGMAYQLRDHKRDAYWQR